MSRTDARVLVVGAGPVGLVTALVLNQQGIKVQIMDEQWRGTTRSYALALHPSSLELLDDIGLAEELIEAGISCGNLYFYDRDGQRLEIDFGRLDVPFPFVLILPQSVLEKRLEKELHHHGITVQWNHRVEKVEQAGDRVSTQIDRLAKESFGYSISHTEWVVEETLNVETDFVIGADGHRSLVRQATGGRFERSGEPTAFAIFEFSSTHQEKQSRGIKTVLTDDGDGSLWPVREGQFRWSLEISASAYQAEARDKERLLVQFRDSSFPYLDQAVVQELVAKRAAWCDIPVGEIAWSAVVQFEKRLVDRFGRRRVWLVGDAAHLFTPLGSQSMNVGFLEGAELSQYIASCLKAEGSGQVDGQSEQLEQNFQSRWQSIFCLGDRVQSSGKTPDWVRRHAGRIVTAIPATGDDLNALLRQVGLTLGS